MESSFTHLPPTSSGSMGVDGRLCSSGEQPKAPQQVLQASAPGDFQEEERVVFKAEGSLTPVRVIWEEEI